MDKYKMIRVVHADGSDLTPEQIAARELAAEKAKLEQSAWKEKQKFQQLHAVEISIKELRKVAVEKATEADRLERLFTEFPDLLRHENRWKVVRYYSKSINPRANKYDISHNCGCCSDSPLEVWPYLETENGNVYSDPPRFTVGEKSYYGDRPYPGWKEDMRKADIPESIIESIMGHFRHEAESAREDLESNFNEINSEPEPIL
jgi:hypothetical protein